MKITDNIKSGFKICSDKISDLDKIVLSGNAKAGISASNVKTNKKYKGVTVDADTQITALQLAVAGVAVIGAAAIAAAVISKMIEKKVIKKLKKKYILIPMEGNDFGCGCGSCNEPDICYDYCDEDHDMSEDDFLRFDNEDDEAEETE